MPHARTWRLFDKLHVAHGDGSFARRLAQPAKLGLLVIDDFAISPIGAAERNDLLERLGIRQLGVSGSESTRGVTDGIDRHLGLEERWGVPAWSLAHVHPGMSKRLAAAS